MQRAEALKILGLVEPASEESIHAAFNEKSDEIREWMTTAPSNNVKISCRGLLQTMEKARESALREPPGVPAGGTPKPAGQASSARPPRAQANPPGQTAPSSPETEAERELGPSPWDTLTPEELDEHAEPLINEEAAPPSRETRRPGVAEASEADSPVDERPAAESPVPDVDVEHAPEHRDRELEDEPPRSINGRSEPAEPSSLATPSRSEGEIARSEREPREARASQNREPAKSSSPFSAGGDRPLSASAARRAVVSRNVEAKVAVGDTLAGRFRLDEAVGPQRFVGTDLAESHPVLIRLLPRSLTENADRKATLLESVKAVRKLGHPNIATYRQLQMEGQQPIAVMDLPPGGPLSRLGPRLDPSAVLRAVGNLAEVVSELHPRFTVGSLSSESIWVDGSNVVVTEVGLPPAEADRANLAPELVDLDTLPTPASDQFGIGMLLASRTDLPRAAQGAIARATAPQPARRFESVPAFRAALRASSGSKRGLVAAAAVIIAVAGLAGTANIWMPRVQTAIADWRGSTNSVPPATGGNGSPANGDAQSPPPELASDRNMSVVPPTPPVKDVPPTPMPSTDGTPMAVAPLDPPEPAALPPAAEVLGPALLQAQTRLTSLEESRYPQGLTGPELAVVRQNVNDAKVAIGKNAPQAGALLAQAEQSLETVERESSSLLRRVNAEARAEAEACRRTLQRIGDEALRAATEAPDEQRWATATLAGLLRTRVLDERATRDAEAAFAEGETAAAEGRLADAVRQYNLAASRYTDLAAESDRLKDGVARVMPSASTAKSAWQAAEAAEAARWSPQAYGASVAAMDRADVLLAESQFDDAISAYGRAAELFGGSAESATAKATAERSLMREQGLLQVSLDRIDRDLVGADAVDKATAALATAENADTVGKARMALVGVAETAYLQAARTRLSAGELDLAQNAVQQLLAMSPENTAARDLQGRIRAEGQLDSFENALGMRMCQVPDAAGVPTLYVAATEVSVGQFRQFVSETNYQTDAERSGYAAGLKDKTLGVHAGMDWKNPGFSQKDEDPVVCVSRNDALAFCRWLSGKGERKYRLPTADEWRRAAAGVWPGGEESAATFAWGTEPADGVGWVNGGDRAMRHGLLMRFDAETDFNLDDGFIATAPVNWGQPNRWGLKNVHGNVAEWAAGKPVILGGGWSDGPASTRLNAERPLPADRATNYSGFRVVAE